MAFARTTVHEHVHASIRNHISNVRGHQWRACYSAACMLISDVHAHQRRACSAACMLSGVHAQWRAITSAACMLFSGVHAYQRHVWSSVACMLSGGPFCLPWRQSCGVELRYQPLPRPRRPHRRPRRSRHQRAAPAPMADGVHTTVLQAAGCVRAHMVDVHTTVLHAAGCVRAHMVDVHTTVLQAAGCVRAHKVDVHTTVW